MMCVNVYWAKFDCKETLRLSTTLATDIYVGRLRCSGKCIKIISELMNMLVSN